jgi:hypothetical protein
MSGFCRKAYVLTCDVSSERALFSKSILDKIGFDVVLFPAIPDPNKVVSNKLSMMAIYDIIAKGDDEWGYVFEDDINVMEDITLGEIVEYETISTMFFYLGVCDYGPKKTNVCDVKMNDHPVSIASGQVRGLHAIGLSKRGADELLAFIRNNWHIAFMDVCLEEFSKIYPANIVRYDLESYLTDHRGIIYQDRIRFPSTIDMACAAFSELFGIIIKKHPDVFDEAIAELYKRRDERRHDFI